MILFIKDLRNFVKNKKNIADLDLFICSKKSDVSFILKHENIIKSIFKINKIKFSDLKIEKKLDIFISSEIKYGFIIKKDESDKELISNINYYKSEISYLSKKLENENFVNNAPKNIVEEQIKKIDKAKKNLKLLEDVFANKDV